MIIAIDGPAGVGKSSVAKRCAAAFSFVYINSGLLYRIVTAQALETERASGGRADRACVAERLAHCPPRQLAADYRQHIRDSQLHRRCYTAAVDEAVGAISTILSVRKAVNSAIVLLEQESDCIVEGRDIASVVHRDADLKIYLDASVAVRAARRTAERQAAGSQHDYQVVLHNIQKRDTIDWTKKVGTLIVESDSIKIDTTHLTFSRVCAIVSEYIMQVLNRRSL